MNSCRKNLPRPIFAVFILLIAFEIAYGVRLPVKIYTSADGLGSSFIDFIYRDSRGFMWFSTRDGLSRFDGSTFITYQIGEKNSPPGIETVSETRDGSYWISTTGGLFRYHPGRILPPDGDNPRIPAEWVSGWRGPVFEDSRGNIWLASAGIFRLKKDGEKYEFEKVDWNIPPKPNVNFVANRILETADGSLWVDTNWGIIRRLPDERIVFYQENKQLAGGAGTLSMMADKTGRIWFSRRNEFYVLKPEPPDAFPLSENIFLKPIEATSVIEIKTGAAVPLPKIGGELFQFTNAELIDKAIGLRLTGTSDGTIWASANDNLLEINGGILRAYNISEGLPATMGRIEEDAAGNLWIGSYAGLARLDRQGLKTYGVADGAVSPRFFAITEDADGTVYFANADDHIARFDGSKLETVRLNVDQKQTHTWTSRFIYLDKSGDWWFLSVGKLYRFSGVKNFKELANRPPTKVYTVEDGLKSENMFQIFEDSTGDIWISTRGINNPDHGLSRLKKGAEKFQAFTDESGYPPKKSVSSFAEDRYGNIWVTFYEGGLGRFDGDRFEVFYPHSEMAESLLSDLHIDAKGRLWVSSTVNGLIRIDDPSAKQPAFGFLTTADGLSSNNIRTLTEDRFGRLYLGSARGVDCLSPETGHIKHFSVSDGLAADFVIDSHRDRHGNLWFVTSNGVSQLVPQLDEKPSPPNILVGGLRIAGVEQAVSNLGSSLVERGELAHTENSLQIEFFGLDFRTGQTLRYQYKLEGADADWSAPTEQKTVTFANLSPGSYRFLVRAVSSQGITSETPAVVSFRILSPIWARWWFIAVCAAAVFFVAGAFFRYRVARLREINAALEEARRAEESLRKSKEERLAELEQVRSRIATDLHDDIGASLTQIAILSEVAQAQSKNGASEPLKLISNVSNELVGTMSDIVWSINPQKDHFSDLTQRMRRFASDVLTAKNIALQFHSAHEDAAITVNSNIRREVFLIFKEAVNNIVKHAEASRVEIVVKLENDLLHVEITDNGKGFDVSSNPPSEITNSQSDGGNGLPSMQKRASEMNGRVEILSIPERGTTVKLSLPLEATAQTGGESVL